MLRKINGESALLSIIKGQTTDNAKVSEKLRRGGRGGERGRGGGRGRGRRSRRTTEDFVMYVVRGSQIFVELACK